MKVLIALVLVVGACKKGHSVEVGPVATPFGPTRDVHFGMTPDEFNAVAAGLTSNNTSPPSWGGDYDVDGKWNLISMITTQDGHASEIILEIQQPAFMDTIKKAWGPGVDAPGLGEDTLRRYFNEAAGTRADLSDKFHNVKLRPFRPVAKLLDGPDPWSVMGVKLLGRPIKDVTAELERQRCYVLRDESTKDVLHVALPADEWTDGPSMLTLDLDANGVVSEWDLDLADDRAKTAKAPLDALFETKWGKPRAIENKGDAYGTAPGALWHRSYLEVKAQPTW